MWGSEIQGHPWLSRGYQFQASLVYYTEGFRTARATQIHYLKNLTQWLEVLDFKEDSSSLPSTAPALKLTTVTPFLGI